MNAQEKIELVYSSGDFSPREKDEIAETLSLVGSIESETGLPLHVLCKALKRGYYEYKYGVVFKHDFPTLSLTLGTIDNNNLSDYGKTWALTKEKLKK